MVQGQVFLKDGIGLALSLDLIFSRLIIFTFRNYFSYPLPKLCYAFEKKLFFTSTII